MIFSRRSIQRRLDELRTLLNEDAVDAFVSRLNQPKQRLATMWEVVILHGLAKHGRINYEQSLISGRRPDICFVGATSFTADVACVSDRGLDEENPVEKLVTLLEALKTRLGLPPGGMDITISGKYEQAGRGVRVRLRIPESKNLGAFVRDEIKPILKRQIAEGRTVLSLQLDDDEYSLALRIDPNKSPINLATHPSYNVPTINDRNPLANVLERNPIKLYHSRRH
jgi:hypothetical protein